MLSKIKDLFNPSESSDLSFKGEVQSGFDN